jgi:ATP-dependent DNA ligase
MTIKEIFDEIGCESSTNKKVEILSKYKDNELLKRVLYLANSKRVKFYIKQIPEYECGPFNQGLEVALDSLTPISSRNVTGHAAINHLKATLEFCDNDDAHIIECIIEKDCKMNLGTSLINKVFPKLIEETPYMGAKSFSEDLAKKIFKDGYAYSQIKMDGRYCNAIIRSGDVELESRQGEPTILIGAKFLEELKGFEDCVLNGELTIDGISRYESNGIVASLISISKKKLDGEDVSREIDKFQEKHMNYSDALDSIRFTIWDTIYIEEYFNAKSDLQYNLRLNRVGEMLRDYNPTMVSLVETKVVESYELAMSHFQGTLNKGFEGTILKSNKGTWKDGKPNFQVKMKLEMDVDLKIVGFNYGTGKNANVISSINAESSDGKVYTRPTGINEEMMNYITENQDKLLGTIVEVKCCGLSNDSDGNYALLHPVFKTLRDDKLTCDTLQSIQEIEAMAKGLK